ncbi:cell division protein FtsQ/DivIB [Roseateles flavus]|uniref:Cell division protein FtsQ n=1 Tax=Roseateles flavus TaxID=3149041 RepID=A0ABV0GE18_9BURK
MRSTTLNTPLPPDIRLMNGVSALLVLGVLLAAVSLGLQWLVRQPVFAIRAITVEGDVNRNSAASLRANALPRMSGSFLSMNLQQTRAAFEAVPWVRHATVQRLWPARLQVTLEEHQPAAYWETKPEGADAESDATVERLLVNDHGEVFQANLGDVEDEDLPLLSGPEKSSAHMLKLWQQLQAQTARLEDSISRLDLSGRGSWRATLEKGTVIELGRGTDAEVLARYTQYVSSITQVSARFHTAVLSADLRHIDGYAVRLRGISTSTTTPGKPGAKKN